MYAIPEDVLWLISMWPFIAAAIVVAN